MPATQSIILFLKIPTPTPHSAISELADGQQIPHAYEKEKKGKSILHIIQAASHFPTSVSVLDLSFEAPISHLLPTLQEKERDLYVTKLFCYVNKYIHSILMH